MSATTDRVKTKVSALTESLDMLEEKLGPLLAQSLPEAILNLDTIQQAKLQTLIPYLVYDLIFIYLKSRGIDPKTHPVLPELDRVREYFGKIAAAETNEKKRTELDKGAAKRFIVHAITQSKFTKQAAAFVYDSDAKNLTDGTNVIEGGPSVTVDSDVRVPVKVTSKMIARAQFEKELRELDEEDEEEETLEMFDDVPEEEEAIEVIDVDMEEPVSSKSKGKGKAKEESNVGGKRRRAAMDPFAGKQFLSPKICSRLIQRLSGYGDDDDAAGAATPPKKTKSRKDAIAVDTSSNQGTPAGSNQPSPSGTPAPLSSDKRKTKTARKKRKSAGGS